MKSGGAKAAKSGGSGRTGSKTGTTKTGPSKSSASGNRNVDPLDDGAFGHFEQERDMSFDGVGDGFRCLRV